MFPFAAEIQVEIIISNGTICTVETPTWDKINSKLIPLLQMFYTKTTSLPRGKTLVLKSYPHGTFTCLNIDHKVGCIVCIKDRNYYFTVVLDNKHKALQEKQSNMQFKFLLQDLGAI